MLLKILILILIQFPIICMDQQSKEKTQGHELKLTHPKDLIDPKTKMPFKCESEAWEAFWNKAYQRDYLLQQILIPKKLSEQKKLESLAKADIPNLA
jgi:hypothetical protein